MPSVICPSCNTGVLIVSDDEDHFLHVSEAGVLIDSGECPLCHKWIITMIRNYFRPSGGGMGDQAAEILYPETDPCDRRLSPAIPEAYIQDFREAIATLKYSTRASAALSRRVLERILIEHFRVEQGRNLFDKIQTFLAEHSPPSFIKDNIDAVRQVGNLAIHTMFSKTTGEVVEVETGEAEWLLTIVESMLDYAFVMPEQSRQRWTRLAEKLDASSRTPERRPTTQA